MSRREAREVAFKLVFEYTFSMEIKEDVLNEYIAEVDADEANYIRRVYFGVSENFEKLKAEIDEKLKNFSPERVFKTDYAILLLAVYEIEFMEEIPFKVSVNEAIALSKKYSTQKSSTFVNGVLSAFSGEK